MEFINFFEHLLNIMLVRRNILFSQKKLRAIKLPILLFTHGCCCEESDVEKHTSTGAKIDVVLRNWNRSEDGHVYKFKNEVEIQQSITWSVSVKLGKAGVFQ